MRAPRSPITGPYKGLVPYFEEDAPFFFGRDADRKVVTANLLGSRLTLLYGASGVGKSSILRAGVVHHLRRMAKENRKDGAPELAVVVFDSWQNDPVADLLAAVQNAVAEALGASPIEAPETTGLCATLGAWADRLGGDLLIILDQFEEYLLHEKSGTDSFNTEFVRAVNAPQLRVNFLISIREDALAWLDRFKGKIPALFENYLRLDHLTRESAREAIVRPLEEWYRRTRLGPEGIDPDLVEEILNQVSRDRAGPADALGPGSIAGEGRIKAAVLQVVMTRLWQEGKNDGSTHLRLKTLQKFGDMKTIFEDHLKDRLHDLSRRERKVCAHLFRYLVTPGGVRIALSAQDLEEFTKLSRKQTEPVLEKLKGRNVLVGSLYAVGEVRYEIPYDSLGLAIFRWRQQSGERRKGVQKRWLKWGIPIVIPLMGISWGVWNRRIEDQKRLAAAERLAAKALYYSDRRLDVALLLAVQAGRTRDSGEVRNGLLSTLQKVPRLKAFLHGNPSSVSDLALDPAGSTLAAGTFDGHVQLWDISRGRTMGPPLDAHADRTRVSGLAFYPGSPSSSKLATAGEDGAIYLWDLHRRRSQALIEPRLELDRRNKGFSSLALSEDGRLLAAGEVNGTVLLWNLTRRPRRSLRLEPGGGEWPVVAFSPNGRVLAVGSPDGAVRLYGSSGRLLATLNGDSGPIVSLAVNPTGKMVAAGTRLGKVLLWRLANRQPLDRPASAHTGGVWALAFSPNGERLATGGADGRVRLWNWSEESRLEPDGEPLTGGHSANIYSIVFSGDGKVLVSGDAAGRICLWSLESNPPLGERLGSVERGIESVAFSADGRLLASGGIDGHLRLWELDRRQIVKETFAKGAIWSVAFSPNDSLVAWGELRKKSENSESGTVSAQEIGKVHLWNYRRDPSDSSLLEPEGRGVEGLAFSPNGKILAWADLDWTIRLWDLPKNRSYHELSGHKYGVWDVAFSPDGKALASCGEDQTVRLWDVNRGLRTGTPLTGHKKGVTVVAYAPGGNVLASGGLDGQVLLWDVKRHQLIGPLVDGHAGGVSGVDFSPDGKLGASCGRDRQIRLWNPLTRQPVGNSFGEHGGEVESIAFHPDGRRLASGDSEGNLYLWDVDFNSWLSRACAKANRNLSLDEWRQFVDPEAPYEKTCPTLPLGEGVSEKGSVNPGRE